MFKLQKLPVRLILISCISAMLALLISAQVSALADPTRPSGHRSVAKKQALKLESILFGTARKVAVINGLAVTEGDSIGSAKIIHINKDSVTVNSNGRIAELMLHRAAIRQEK